MREVYQKQTEWNTISVAKLKIVLISWNKTMNIYLNFIKLKSFFFNSSHAKEILHKIYTEILNLSV